MSVEANPLADIRIVNIFSPFCGLPFHFLNAVFHRAEVLDIP